MKKFTETLYKQFFDLIPEVIFIIEPKSEKIIYANDFFFSETGYNRSDIERGSVSSFGFWTSRKKYENFIIAVRKKNSVRGIISDFTLANGSIKTFMTSGLQVQSGSENYILCSIIDITKQKAAESELLLEKQKAEESDRLKSSFLARMSHEIRTPLNSILGFADLIRNEQLTKEEVSSYADIITNNGNMLLRIVEDIIDFSRLEAGQVELNKTETDINKIIDSLYERYLDEVLNKKLKLKRIKIDIPELTIKVDPIRIKQVLSLLLENAIKFTFSGGISFGYEIKDETITFFVSDTGIGIEKDFLEVIFQRYIKAETDSQSKTFDGTGLGLSIAKGIVNLLGSEIKVESEPGKGSRFYFSLIFRTDLLEQKESRHTIRLSEKVLQKLSILIAEDTYDNYKFLKLVFGRYDIPVHHARNGKEAIDTFKKIPTIKLVLMDLHMPVMDGYEATREIKKIRKRVKVIALTAYAFNNDKQSALNAGCDDYLAKPVSRSELIRKINEVFEQ